MFIKIYYKSYKNDKDDYKKSSFNFQIPIIIMFNEIKKCRLSNSSNLTSVLNLGCSATGIPFWPLFQILIYFSSELYSILIVSLKCDIYNKTYYINVNIT